MGSVHPDGLASRNRRKARGGIQGCVSVARTMGSGYESVERLARRPLQLLRKSRRFAERGALQLLSLPSGVIISDEIGLNTEQLELTQAAH